MRYLRRTALVLAAVIGLALLLLAACEGADSSGPAPTPRGEGTPPADGGPLAFTTIDTGDQSGIDVNKPEAFKIETQEKWADFWSRHKANVIPPPAPPSVDFSQQMVIVVLDQQRPSGGFQLEITEVVEAEGKLVVRVSERAPGAGCVVTAVITQPYHIVSSAGSQLNPELAISEETYSCDSP